MVRLVLDDEDMGALAEGIAARLRDAGPLEPPVQLARPTLTPQENRILPMLLGGASNDEIAAILQISRRTVEVHRGAIQAKMKAKSPIHLGWLAACMGIDAEDVVPDKRPLKGPRNKRTPPLRRAGSV